MANRGALDGKMSVDRGDEGTRRTRMEVRVERSGGG